MKSKLLILIVVCLALNATAQKKVTLQECYDLVDLNYPMAKQADLLSQKATFEIDALHTAKLPKMDLNAQATYQSEVIGFPAALPGVNAMNRDQYRATMDINQLIYNGGTIAAHAKLKQAQNKTQQQQVALNIYATKNKINQYFFSILLLQQKKQLLESKNELLISKVKEVTVGVKYGALLPTSELILQAERLKIKQQLTEISFEKTKMLENLALLTYSEMDATTVLETPDSKREAVNGIRPEIVFFDLHNEQIESSKSVLAKSNSPKLYAFGQAGYGNPGLNMLDNSFQPFYIVGLRTSWNIFDWGKVRKDRKSLDVAQEIIQTEKENFELNNKIELQQINKDIKKMEELLTSDLEIIQIHEKIVKSADAQMKNGVITSSEYLTEVIRLFEAKNNLAQHEVTLHLALANYQVSAGN